MMGKTRNRELTKLINGMEALGYQVDAFESLPGGFITVKISPSPDNTAWHESPSTRRKRGLIPLLDNPTSAAT